MSDGTTRRDSLRYPGYDYSQAGAVFVTIGTQGRQHLFGSVRGGEVQLSPAGIRAHERWSQIPERFPDMLIDTFIVMPDHIHGIILNGAAPGIVARTTTGEIVRWFKSAMFADYTTSVRKHGWVPYDRQLWQRNFHDHIIRTERELNQIRQYIDANPARWQERRREETIP